MLIITLWTVCLIATISPELIKLSNWLDVGSLTLKPVPEACKAITPAVEVEVPTELAEFVIEPSEEDELVDREEPIDELTIAVLVEIDVTAPVELKVKV